MAGQVSPSFAELSRGPAVMIPLLLRCFPLTFLSILMLHTNTQDREEGPAGGEGMRPPNQLPVTDRVDHRGGHG